MREYNVNLKKPNKCYQIKQAHRKERIFKHIKNAWKVRNFFIDNFSVDSPIINGDQMPLHGNESTSYNTFNINGYKTYIK